MVHVVPPVSSKKPFPENIKSSLPLPETPWQISPSLFSRIQSQTSNLAFRVCEIISTDPEYDFILKFFEYQKPPGFGIKRIVCIHNPTHTQVFEGSLKNMEQEANNPYFSPQGRNEEPRADRAKVLYRWHQQVALFSPVMVTDSQAHAEPCFNAKVLPLWHGSSETVCKSVCSSGFTSFGKHHYFDENASKGTNKSTDKGYFGSGIYFTNSAQYATIYSSEGHLLLAWVSMREPYPVVNDVSHPQKGSDMRKLEGKEHYQNYNAHFVPVASIRPEDPKCIEYYPCYKDQPPAWDEFVVFHSAQTLPRFWVELGVDLPKTLPLNPPEPKKEPVTSPIKIFQPSPPSAIISPLQEVCSKMGCLKIYNDHAVNSLNKLFIHPNGTLVSSSNGINIWNTSTDVCVRNYPISPDRSYPHFLLSNGLLLSQKIIQSGKYNELAIWNLETGALIRTFGKFKNTSSLHSCILLAPDILAVGVGYEIYIWDLSKGQCLLTLEQQDSVSALVPLPQGKLICGSYWITKLWDLSTGECIRDWGGSTFILPLDSTIVASANINDKTIKFWDYSTGQCTKTLKGHQEWVHSLLRLQNGLLVSASNDHTIKLWDTLTGECLRTLEGHTSQVNSLALLPNETFASGSMDGTIRIWGTQPQTVSPISPPIHESPSGKNYARQPQVLDKKKEELGVDLPKTLSLNPPEPKKEPVTSPIKIFQPPPPSAIISPLQEVCSKMGCLKTLQAHRGVWDLSVHANGTLISYSENDKTIKTWDTLGGKCVRTYPFSLDWPHPHFLLPNGNLLTQTQNRQAAAIWNLETGKSIRTFGKFLKHIYSFNLLAPDTLAVGSCGKILIWDLEKNQCLLTLDHTNYVFALVPLPQGKFISGSVMTTKLWDLSTGECIREWGGSTFILPLDSTIVATACLYDKTIKFWDYSTGRCTKTLKGHQDTITFLLRLPNGLLVSASNDHTIKLWDTLTGECLRTLEGHTSQVTSLALLPNETFASGSMDGTIRIWGIQPQSGSPISPPIYESPSAKQYAEQLQKIDEIKKAQKEKLERLKAKQEKPFIQNPAFSTQPDSTNASGISVKAAPINASPQPVASLAPVLPKSSAKPAFPAIAFGKEEWATYIGDVDDVPPLPPDIDQILQSPCPFWPGKKVEETHLLTLIPKKVNGKPLTLNYLNSLNPKQGKAMQYSWYWDEIKKEYGEKPLQSSYWALMTRDVIPGSRGKRYNDQARLLKELSQKAKVPYEVPHLLEAVTSIFMEYFRTEKDLYGENPLTYTRCQERVSSIPDLTLVVGHFEHNHLYSTIGVYYNNEDEEGEHNQFFGIGGLRKLSNNLSTPDDALAKQTLQKPLPPTPKTKTLPTEIAFTTSPVHSSSPSAATLDPVFSQAPKTPPAAAFVKASPPREKEEELSLQELQREKEKKRGDKQNKLSRLKGFFFSQREGSQPK